MAKVSDKAVMPDPTLVIDLCVDDESWQAIDGLEHVITTAAKAALLQVQAHKQTISDDAIGLTVVLDNNERIESLNADWRDKQKPTNILSFPAPKHSRSDTGETYIGDLILAYGVIYDEANEQRKALATHLCHLIIHGVLHLAGFDHQNDDEAVEMEQLEIKAMAALGLPDPYQIKS